MPGSAEGAAAVAAKPPGMFGRFTQRFKKEEKPGKLTRRELLLALGTALGIQVTVSAASMTTEALMEKLDGYEAIPAEARSKKIASSSTALLHIAQFTIVMLADENYIVIDCLLLVFDYSMTILLLCLCHNSGLNVCTGLLGAYDGLRGWFPWLDRSVSAESYFCAAWGLVGEVAVVRSLAGDANGSHHRVSDCGPRVASARDASSRTGSTRGGEIHEEHLASRLKNKWRSLFTNSASVHVCPTRVRETCLENDSNFYFTFPAFFPAF
jgi:hypothetical protein